MPDILKRDPVQLLTLIVTIGIASLSGASWFFGANAEGRAAVRSATEQVASLSEQVSKLASKIDALPRASDLADRDRRQADAEASVARLAARVSDVERMAIGVRADLDNVLRTTGSPARAQR